MNAPHTRRTLSPLALFAALATPGGAGDIAPPAGPIAPTHKTLTEVEPRIAITQENTPGDDNSVFRITAPGSYYLVENLVIGDKLFGIEIAASDVTIDLNGFSVIDGTSTATGIGDDPLNPVTPERLTVRSGRLVACRFGVNVGAVVGCRLEGLVCTDAAHDGLRVGARSVVRDCITRNGTINLVGEGSIAERCIVNGSGDYGFLCSSGSQITDCTAINNPLAGIAATVFSGNVAIEGCFVAGNLRGIVISHTGCTVVRNVAKGNSEGNYSISIGDNHVGAIVSDPAVAGPWDNISN